MPGLVRGVAPFVVALALVIAAFVVTAGDLAYVALGVMTTAFIVGGIGSGSLLARGLLYGALASLALVGFSTLASEDASLVARVAEGVAAQVYTPLWSMPLAGFGVWVGHDFRRSLEEIAGRR
jgi:hypothetical protein